MFTILVSPIEDKKGVYQQLQARLWSNAQTTEQTTTIVLHHSGSVSPDDVKLYVHTQEHLDRNDNDVSSMFGYFRSCDVLTVSSTKTTYTCDCDVGVSDTRVDVGCRYVFLNVKPGITLCDIMIPQ